MGGGIRKAGSAETTDRCHSPDPLIMTDCPPENQAESAGGSSADLKRPDVRKSRVPEMPRLQLVTARIDLKSRP